jgi:hypothetical protein
MYARTYRKADRVPNNAWLERPIQSADEGPQMVRKVIGKLAVRGTTAVA